MNGCIFVCEQLNEVNLILQNSLHCYYGVMLFREPEVDDPFKFYIGHADSRKDSK